MKKIMLLCGALLVSVAAYFVITQFLFAQPTSPEPTPSVIVENTPSPGTVVSYEFMATESGTLALELVQQLADIETKDFGAAGKFVTSINGLTADEGHYWGFYVNDQFAQKGVSQTVLQEGDTIRFTYEELDPSQL